VTGFDELARGDIIWAADPLSEKGRPLLVLGTPKFPTHGVQLITVVLSTKSYHEQSITLRDTDYKDEPLGERSHVLPWALITLNNPADVEWYLTSLVEDRTDDVAGRVTDYIS